MSNKQAHQVPLQIVAQHVHLVLVKVTEEDKLVEAAEEALNDQYDRQVEDYYQEAKIQAEAANRVFEENAIGKLFEEK